VWVVPASAASALVVTPSTALVDFRSVTVAGSWFPANSLLGLVQCTVDATDPIADGDLNTVQLPTSDSNVGSPASALLEFDPNVPPQPRLQLAVTVDPKGTVLSKLGLVTVRGTVSCSKPAQLLIDVLIQQRAGRVLIQGDASVQLQCDGTIPWAASGQARIGTFQGGSAQIDATVFGSTAPADRVRGGPGDDQIHRQA
jgi:hypothetical protein